MNTSIEDMANAADGGPVPRGNITGFMRNLVPDMVSGLLVFLIALPLCLAISLASGFPAIAGVFTAIVGATLTMFISNSELTIKGPAAGMIVIVLGAVTHFGWVDGGDAGANFRAYQMVLAVGIVAGVVQIIFGLIRAGVLGDFFPTAAVHGMLAAIGVIIMLKQLPVTVGQKASGEPLHILKELPHLMSLANPDIAIIGLGSLFLMFAIGYWKTRTKNSIVKAVPAQLVVLILAVVAGYLFKIDQQHTYSFFGHEFELSEKFLVNVPNNLLGAIAFPDFSAFTDATFRGGSIKWVIMFALIGSLESMLSAKAVDMIDPWKRKTNLNRDLVAVGIANTVAAGIGGLPMISEIVRSKANIDNGARTRFANFWHGMFLLGFVALLPALIHRIPQAALAAMLVYTGFRLASPKEFINVYRIGREQLLIFVTTLVAVLATDLLVGIAIGIGTKLAIHILNGLPLQSMFKPYLEVDTSNPEQVVINAKESAVFTNFIPFKRQIEQLGLVQRHNVVVDLSEARLVDHSVMEKLHELQMDFENVGLKLDVIGLDRTRPLSDHPYASRVKGLQRGVRGTVLIPVEKAEAIEDLMHAAGVEHYTSSPCAMLEPNGQRLEYLKIEFIDFADVGAQVLHGIQESTEFGPETNAALDQVQLVMNRRIELPKVASGGH
ncbi:MAG: SulP family inorganic anion transporter [Pirellulaceae bacterium]